MIPFLSLKDVTAAHGEENARFGKNPPSFQPGASNSFCFSFTYNIEQKLD